MPPRNFPRPVAVFTNKTEQPCTLFTLDNVLSYLPFAKDFGPFNISYVIQAIYALEEKFELIRHRASPWQAFQAIAAMEVRPFRDAGMGPDEHGLYIEDCLYALDKALSFELLDFKTFSKSWYRYYEQVVHGDLNIVGDFIAFASPQEEAHYDRYQKAIKAKEKGESFEWYEVPRSNTLSHAFENVLNVFVEQNVGMVVRLNDVLSHFLDRNIHHVEMYFDDGTNPTDEIVRAFIDLSEDVIERKGKRVAVHCKAGLGRTGVLIGAYLIYKYHFSAQEAIAFMRLMRPGMVVASQQQYMLQNQMKWVSWSARDALLKELAEQKEAEEPVNPLATPPADFDPPSPWSSARRIQLETSILEEVTTKLGSHSDATVRAGKTLHSVATLKGDAAGQPRKGIPLPQRQSKAIPAESSVNIRVRAATPPPIRTTSVPPVSAAPKSATPTASPASTRGVKRASSRKPIPVMPSTCAAHLSPAVDLERSSSTASLASSTSSVARPAKKAAYDATRLGSSPLAKTGLSSPPVSRENTPADDEEMSVDPPSPLTKVVNKLRRKPTAIVVPAVKPITGLPTPTPPSQIKSMLPVRKSSLPKDKSPPPRSIPMLEEIAERPRKKGLTPPNLLRFSSYSQFSFFYLLELTLRPKRLGNISGRLQKPWYKRPPFIDEISRFHAPYDHLNFM